MVTGAAREAAVVRVGRVAARCLIAWHRSARRSARAIRRGPAVVRWSLKKSLHSRQRCAITRWTEGWWAAVLDAGLVVDPAQAVEPATTVAAAKPIAKNLASFGMGITS